MAFCSNCGTAIIDHDKFCPSCGYKTPLKIQEIEARNNKIKSAAGTTENIIMAIFGIPFLAVGLGIALMGAIVFLIKLYSPFNALVQFIFLAITGAILAKIGMWSIEQIPEGGTNRWAKVISLIGMFMFLVAALPGYITKTELFY